MSDRPRHSARVPRPDTPQPTMAELAGRLEQGMGHLSEKIDSAVMASERRTGERIGAVHADVALLRQTVLADHAPRITAVEKRTPAQQVSRAACWVGKGTAYGTLIAVGARLLGKAYPQFDGAINEVLGAFGL